MYIKETEYDQIAFICVNKSLDCGFMLNDKKDLIKAIDKFLPDKYHDDNNSQGKYWTKHNEEKLLKYMRSEIYKKAILKGVEHE